MSGVDFDTYYRSLAREVEGALENALPPAGQAPAELHAAMRYSVFAGGKRLRGVLALAAAECISGERGDALALAAAVECIHTYSLIHDDLPAMDDDDFRRGKPSCHKAYGEAMAILAGDGLQSLAFELASRSPRAVADVVSDLASSAGLRGMVAGQAFDMLYQGHAEHLTLPDVQRIHMHKTGALIRCSVRVGAMAAGASPTQLEAMTVFGDAVGLGFQIVDDLLDLEATDKTLGKTAGKDARQKKITYPAVMGVDDARSAASGCIRRAHEAIAPFRQRGERLARIADFVLRRKQ